MPRKSNNSKRKSSSVSGNFEKWNSSDFNCARLMNSCCNVAHEKCIDSTHVSEYRLKEWKKSGLIEKVDTINGAHYRTTPRGREIFELVSGSKPYISNSFLHDDALADVYISLTPEEQKSWMTEAEIREYCQNNSIDIEGTSITDGAYISSFSGEFVCVEIVTRHYTETMIELKKEFAEIFGGSYEQYQA